MSPAPSSTKGGRVSIRSASTLARDEEDDKKHPHSHREVVDPATRLVDHKQRRSPNLFGQGRHNDHDRSTHAVKGCSLE